MRLIFSIFDRLPNSTQASILRKLYALTNFLYAWEMKKHPEGSLKAQQLQRDRDQIAEQFTEIMSNY